MKIKSVKVEALCRYWCWHNFVTIRNDEGRALYLMDGEIVTKEEGNTKFLELKRKATTFNQDVKEWECTLEEAIKPYEEAIDPYTHYIDNYEQEKAAERRNEHLRKIIAAIKNL